MKTRLFAIAAAAVLVLAGCQKPSSTDQALADILQACSIGVSNATCSVPLPKTPGSPVPLGKSNCSVDVTPDLTGATLGTVVVTCAFQ